MRIFITFLFTVFFSTNVSALSNTLELCAWRNFGAISTYDDLLNKNNRIKAYLEWTNDLSIFFKSVPTLKPSEIEWLKIEKNSEDVSRKMNVLNSKEFAIESSLAFYKNVSTTLGELVSAAEAEEQDREKIHLRVLSYTLTTAGYYDNIDSLYRYGILKDENNYSEKIYASLITNCMETANKVIKLSLRGNLNEK